MQVRWPPDTATASVSAGISAAATVSVAAAVSAPGVLPILVCLYVYVRLLCCLCIFVCVVLLRCVPWMLLISCYLSSCACTALSLLCLYVPRCKYPCVQGTLCVLSPFFSGLTSSVLQSVIKLLGRLAAWESPQVHAVLWGEHALESVAAVFDVIYKNLSTLRVPAR